MKPFNNLTPAEAERLAILVEECGEVIQSAGKILRHGYNSFDPTNPDHKGNRFDLMRELADVAGIIIMMDEANDLSMADILSMAEKLRKKKYLHHQDNNENQKN